MDLYPTLCAAVGATVSDATQLDGVNLLPFITDDKQGPPHDVLFWKPREGGAVRHGDWKLIIESWGNTKPRLYDLGTDVGESNDLAAKHRDLTKRLAKAWEDHFADMPPAVSQREKKSEK